MVILNGLSTRLLWLLFILVTCYVAILIPAHLIAADGDRHDRD